MRYNTPMTSHEYFPGLSLRAVFVDKEIVKAKTDVWYRIWFDRGRVHVTRCSLTSEKRSLPDHWIPSG